MWIHLSVYIYLSTEKKRESSISERKENLLDKLFFPSGHEQIPVIFVIFYF